MVWQRILALRRKILIISVVVFLLLGVGCILMQVYHARKLTNLLSDLSISNLQIGKKIYSMKKGKVIQNVDIFTTVKILDLAAFYQWTKEDPLFYSPDLDTSELKRVVDSIDKNHQEYLDYIHDMHHIYPTNFLKSLVEVATQTKDFLERPSQEIALNLISKQKQTAHLYGSEADSLSIYILKKKQDLKSAAVALLTSTSAKTIASNLKLIARNSDVLLSEIEKRESCIKGIGECVRASERFEKPHTQTQIVPTIKKPLLDTKLIFNYLPNNFDKSQIKGPYIARTPCFGWSKNFTYPEYYFYVLGNNNKGTANIYIELATEIYFRRILDGTAVPFEKILKKSGVRYLRVSPASLYYCNNNEYLAEIAEVDRFITDNKPILSSLDVFRNNLFYKEFDLAKNVEEKFFKNEYPSYEHLKLLGDYYGYLYRITKKENNESNSFRILREELLRRHLVIVRKLGFFERLLGHAFSILQFNTTFDSSLGKNHIYTYNVLYPFKNFYGLMYLPFSSAVFRLNEQPQYVDKVHVKNSVVLDGSYMSYSQAITKYTSNEISSWSLRNAFQNNY